MSAKNYLVEITNKINTESSKYEKIEKIKSKSSYHWRNPDDYFHVDSKSINKFAYFNYQQSKVFVRTNNEHKKIVKQKQNSKKKINNKVNEIVHIIPEKCPHCGRKKFTLAKKTKKVVVDLKFMRSGIKKWTREFNSSYFSCLNCKKKFCIINFTKIPEYGDNLIKFSMNMHIRHNISYKSIAEILMDFKIKVGETNIYDFKTYLAKKYSDTYENLKKGLIDSKLIQADETQVKMFKSSSAYVWVFANMDTVIYIFRTTREADFLRYLFTSVALT